MQTQINLAGIRRFTRITLAAMICSLGFPAATWATTIFDSNFDNGTAGAATSASSLGTPVAGTWSFVGAAQGGITSDASDKAALFGKNTTTALTWVTAPTAVNTVNFGTVPSTKSIDAGGAGVSVLANLASPGSFTGVGNSTTISFNWGQCGTAASGYCKYAFVRGLDAAGNEVFELLLSQLNPANTSLIYARAAADSTTTRSTTTVGTPQGTLLINGFGTDTSFSLPGTATTKPTGLIGVTVTLANGQVTYAFNKGTASGNALTYPVNSAATTITKLEFSTISATDASGSIGYWLNNVLVTKVDAPTYSLTYDGNGATGGTAPVDGGSPYPAGTTITVPGLGDLTNSGHTFTGWNSQADGGGTTYAGTFSMPAVNTTLYAQWLSASATITAPAAFAAHVATTYGTASGSTAVTVSGSGLATDITATAPTGMEVSSDGSTFGPTATFTRSGGSASGTLALRIKSNAPVSGTYDSQNVVLASTGAMPVSVATGTGNSVTAKTLTVVSAAAQGKMFDGTTSATVTGSLDSAEAFGAGTSGDGKPYTGDPMTVTCTGSTFASPAVAADIAVTAGTFTLTGAAAGNYSLTPPAFPALTASIVDTAVWTATTTPANWDVSSNWLHAIAGSGAGNTADFNQVDLAADTTVNLTAPVTIGNLIFGDTETVTTPAAWTLSNNSNPANLLTLAGATPTITVNPLGVDKGVTINAALTGTNGLIKAGSGTLTIGAVTSFTTAAGVTTVNAGTLKLGISNIFGNGNGTPGVINAAGTLDLNGKSCIISNFSGSGTVDNTSATAVILSIGKNNTGGSFSGIIKNTGGGALNLSKFGSSNTTTLAAANTYTGITKVTGGILSINAIGNVGAGASSVGAPTTLADGTISLGLGDTATGTQGTLKYTGAEASTNRVINLSGTTAGGGLNASDNTGPITFTSDLTASGAGAKTLTLSGTSLLNNTLAGKIVDNSPTNTTSVFKSGSGTWVLGADNPYTGITTVSAGTLIVNGTHSVGGLYTVSSTGILGGTGSISASVEVSGKIAPGQGIGTLATGPLVLKNTAVLAMEINTNSATADKIVVTGDVTRPGATVDLALTDVGSDVALPNGTKLTLVDYSGTWDVTKTVRYNGVAVPNESTIVLGANTFAVKYDDDTALTLTVANVASAFETWINGYADRLPDPADRLPTADPDKDGCNNLLEFALNGNPADGANNGKQAMRTTGSGAAGTNPGLTLTLAVRDGAVLSAGANGSVTLTVDGIIYNVQGSLTLVPPFDSPVSEVTPAFALSPAPAAGWTARTFRLDASDNLPGSGFLRVAVSQ